MNCKNYHILIKYNKIIYIDILNKIKLIKICYKIEYI